MTAIKIPTKYKIIILIIAEILEVKINIKFVLGQFVVRKKIIGNGKGRNLIRNSIIITHFWFFVIWLNINNSLTGLGFFTLLIMTEIQGLKVFKGYTQYEYSSVRIFLHNGMIIDCKDISKIKKRFNSLIVLEENKRIKIKYDIILKMEYYGDIKIVV